MTGRSIGRTPYRRVVPVQRMPEPEVDVSVELVRRLLAEQHADLAGLAVGVLANGWDNVICTVGADLLARLPRRALAACNRPQASAADPCAGPGRPASRRLPVEMERGAIPAWPGRRPGGPG